MFKGSTFVLRGGVMRDFRPGVKHRKDEEVITRVCYSRMRQRMGVYPVF